MHLAEKRLLLAYIASAGLVSSSATDRSEPNVFAAALEGGDTPSARFWERIKRDNYPRQSTDDPQTSLTLATSQVQEAYASQGLNASDPNITPSLTSSNNFINFCLTQNTTLTNGKQNPDGSCSPTPMGRLVAKDKIPSCKFLFPKNGSLLAANTTFTVKLATKNLDSGHYSNAETNFFAAPQTTNADGILVGHSHITIEAVPNYLSEDPLDPAHFAFFKAMNAAAVDGVLSVDVANGLPPGVYRLSSITTAINHQPALISVAQHGSVEDAVYFRVSTSTF